MVGRGPSLQQVTCVMSSPDAKQQSYFRHLEIELGSRYVQMKAQDIYDVEDKHVDDRGWYRRRFGRTVFRSGCTDWIRRS